MTKIICVQFTRDESKDTQKDDIQYNGFHFSWPNGTPIKTGLDKFCQRGIRLFFGKEGLQTNSATLNLHCNPVAKEDPLTKTQENVKVRRFFLIRHNDLGTIHFHNGIPTDVTFDVNKEEPEVLQWIGLNELQENQQAWIDIYAIPVDNPIT